MEAYNSAQWIVCRLDSVQGARAMDDRLAQSFLCWGMYEGQARVNIVSEDADV